MQDDKARETLAERREAIEAALLGGEPESALALALSAAEGPRGAQMLALAAVAAIELRRTDEAASMLRDAARRGAGAPAVQRLLARAVRAAVRQEVWAALAPVFLDLPAADDALLAAIALAAAGAGDAGSAGRAAGRIAAPAAVMETLDQAAGLLAARAGWAAAQPLAAMVPEPGIACRTRLARAALRDGALAEATALAAFGHADPDFAALQARICQRAAEAGEAEAAAAVLAAMADPPLPALRAVLDAFGATGRREPAEEILAGRASPGSPQAALLRAVLERGLGQLSAARSALAAARECWPEDVDLLDLALLCARDADDLPEAGRLAADLVRLLPDAAPNRLLDLATLADHGGDGATAAAAAALAERRIRQEMAAPSEEGAGRIKPSLVTPALRLFDLPTARTAIALMPEQTAVWPRLVAAWEADTARDPDVAAFTEEARAAFLRGGATATPADLAVVARMSMPPAMVTDRAAGTVRVAAEHVAARRVLGRTLARARASGLQCVVVPAYSSRVPDDARRLAPLFVAYHTEAELGAGLHVKVSPLPDAVQIDRRGYSGWAEIADQPIEGLPLGDVDTAEAAAWVAAELRRLAEANRSKYAQAERAPLPAFGGPVVLVALQTPADSVLRHAWVEMFTYARGVVQAYAGRGVRVLVKRHPRCQDPRTAALLRDLAAAPHVALTDASIHDLLPAVQAVYVVNSGLGAEALLYGRAVHIAGKVDYRHACHEVHDVASIRTDAGAFAPKLGPEGTARYLYWYRNVNCVPLDRPGALEAAIDARVVEPALRLARECRR